MEQSKIEIPPCEHCKTPLQKHPQKDYWACPNWKPNNKGCPGMIWWPEGLRKNNWPVVAFSYKVPSKSIPGVMRQVKVYESGDVECSCWAGGIGKWCRHKKQMVEDIEKLLNKIKKENCHEPNKPILAHTNPRADRNASQVRTPGEGPKQK